MQKTQLQHCYVNRMGLLLFNPISICSQFRNLLFPSIQCWAHLEMCVQVSLTNSILWLRLTIAYVTGFLYARCFLNICIFFGLERGREGCFGLFVFVCFFPRENKIRQDITFTVEKFFTKIGLECKACTRECHPIIVLIIVIQTHLKSGLLSCPPHAIWKVIQKINWMDI